MTVRGPYFRRHFPLVFKPGHRGRRATDPPPPHNLNHSLIYCHPAPTSTATLQRAPTLQPTPPPPISPCTHPKTSTRLLPPTHTAPTPSSIHTPARSQSRPKPGPNLGPNPNPPQTRSKPLIQTRPKPDPNPYPNPGPNPTQTQPKPAPNLSPNPNPSPNPVLILTLIPPLTHPVFILPLQPQAREHGVVWCRCERVPGDGEFTFL